MLGASSDALFVGLTGNHGERFCHNHSCTLAAYATSDTLGSDFQAPIREINDELRIQLKADPWFRQLASLYPLIAARVSVRNMKIPTASGAA